MSRKADGDDKIFRAIEFAARAHSGHFRKKTRIPYIVHPLGVAKILIEYDCAVDVVAAGILHDTVEDTPVTLEDLERAFGKRIAELVAAASEPDKSDTWDNRKGHTIGYLRTAPEEVLLIACADKLDNILSIREDCERLGEAVWRRFNRGRKKQGWYYTSLAEVLSGRMKNEPGRSLARRFSDEVRRLFTSPSSR
jgi:(p)ppGpp synthase/HD superfamily hydrolase